MPVTIIILFLAIFLVGVNLAMYPDFKYYKETYYRLNANNFKKATSKFNFVEDNSTFYYDIIWMANTDEFQVGPNNFIHNSLLNYLSPYTLYWRIKYLKWFYKNCKSLRYESKI